MRILVLHNKYQKIGGEETVLSNEIKLLKDAGHTIKLYTVSNDEIDTIYKKIWAAISAIHSPKFYKVVTHLIRDFRPDIVHVHNFFPLLSPSVFNACYDCGVPSVLTLHNYRLICSNGLLMRNGKICELCVQFSAYHAVLHGCYRNSRVATLPVTLMIEAHKHLGTWSKKVDRFIALTDFAKKKFIEANLPRDKVVVKPNFSTPSPENWTADAKGRAGALFVGRLSPEKGIQTLQEAWKNLDIPLTILGNGPLRGALEADGNQMIKLLGQKEKKNVLSEMSTSNFMVMPSIWYEGFPMIVVEAFSMKLPVITSKIGSLAEIITHGVTGLHFEAGNANDFRDKVRWAASNPAKIKIMGENAYKVYLEKYTNNSNLQFLMNIYSEAISEKERLGNNAIC